MIEFDLFSLLPEKLKGVAKALKLALSNNDDKTVLVAKKNKKMYFFVIDRNDKHENNLLKNSNITEKGVVND